MSKSSKYEVRIMSGFVSKMDKTHVVHVQGKLRLCTEAVAVDGTRETRIKSITGVFYTAPGIMLDEYRYILTLGQGDLQIYISHNLDQEYHFRANVEQSIWDALMREAKPVEEEPGDRLARLEKTVAELQERVSRLERKLACQ